ncbi:hypothetical protein [Aeoliella sp.]|uniref:hypothetical protein n=1 Tax=Aeoliella sp. TaxID=2795800 RepID=UPI003CCC04A9
MSLSNEIQRLDELRRSGALSHEEFELAKQRVLHGDTDYQSSSHLEEIQMQNAVTQLDREWELERENYMVANKYGVRRMPTKAGSAFGGLMLAGFGVFWTIMAAGIAGGAPGGIGFVFPLFGVLFIVFGVGASIHAFSKADAYNKAQRRYRRRRQDLLGNVSDWSQDGPRDEPFDEPYDEWQR